MDQRTLARSLETRVARRKLQQVVWSVLREIKAHHFTIETLLDREHTVSLILRGLRTLHSKGHHLIDLEPQDINHLVNQQVDCIIELLKDSHPQDLKQGQLLTLTLFPLGKSPTIEVVACKIEQLRIRLLIQINRALTMLSKSPVVIDRVGEAALYLIDPLTREANPITLVKETVPKIDRTIKEFKKKSSMRLTNNSYYQVNQLISTSSKRTTSIKRI